MGTVSNIDVCIFYIQELNSPLASGSDYVKYKSDILNLLDDKSNRTVPIWMRWLLCVSCCVWFCAGFYGYFNQNIHYRLKTFFLKDQKDAITRGECSNELKPYQGLELQSLLIIQHGKRWKPRHFSRAISFARKGDQFIFHRLYISSVATRCLLNTA